MVSGNEWLIVIIFAVLLFGGGQIPKLARSLGQAQKEFKQGIGEGDSPELPVGPSASDTVEVTRADLDRMVDERVALALQDLPSPSQQAASGESS